MKGDSQQVVRNWVCEKNDLLGWAHVPGRVLLQVQLMVCLSSPPLPLTWRVKLCGDGSLPPPPSHLVRYALCDLQLFVIMSKHGTSVLSASVSALSVLGGWVMHGVEEFDKLLVGDDGRVIYHLDGLGICFSAK